MAMSKKALEILVRKIKKKLRQIENLERLNRPLFDEELVKVKLKVSLRNQLKDAIVELNEHEEEEIHKEQENYEIDHKSSFKRNGQEGKSNYLCDDTDSSNNQADIVDDRVCQNSNVIGQHVRKPLDSNVSSFNQRIETVTSTERNSEKTDTSFVKEKVEKKAIEKVEKKLNEKVEKKSKEKVIKKVSLSKKLCKVTSLEGHSDLVTSLVIVGDKLVSASRDTTLRSWDILTGVEEHIFGGHTEYITCVSVLDQTWNHKFELAEPEGDHIIVSGSFDCTLKLWSLSKGCLIKSVYTFNPITCLSLCSYEGLLVSGSDGGKLELWELWSGNNCWSKIVYDGSVTSVQVSGDQVISASATGVIKVHILSEPKELSCVFESENLKYSSGHIVNLRPVRCLEASPCGILYGDDARNVKIVDWKKSLVQKVSNHNNSFSSIDALCSEGDYLVSSSYDLGSGLGYINVRSSQTLEYLGSIDDEDTERMVCLAVQTKGQDLTSVFSGGMELKRWQIVQDNNSRSLDEGEPVVIPLLYRADLAEEVVDSESDFSSDEEEENSEIDIEEREETGNQEDVQSYSWVSWCNIL